MALSADTPRVYELGDINSLPVKASTKVYEGAAVGIDAASGYARGLNAGDAFKGFAERTADNSAGSNGDVRVRVLTKGEVKLAIANAAITDVDKPVYASDDGTFTLTASTNSYVGKIVRWEATGVVIVAFDASQRGIIDADVNAVLAKNFAALALLTDNTAGTADDTLEAMADLGNTYSDAEVNAVLAKIRNNFADLAAKVNAIAALLK